MSVLTDWRLDESLSQNAVEIGGIAAATGILVALSGGSAFGRNTSSNRCINRLRNS